MVKRAILAVVAAFIAWSILDFVIHGLLLQPIYQATPTLWRPMNQINMPLTYLVTLGYTACFTAIYGFMVSNKSFMSGIKFGALFGLAAGISMGFGTYCYMPITQTLAWSWFFGTVFEAIVAGALVGAILKPGKEAS